MSTKKTYEVLPFDRWASATNGLVTEMVDMDMVFFTSLVDASSLNMMRLGFDLSGDKKLSYTAIVLKAISLALRNHPAMNRLILSRPFRHRPIQLHEVHAVVAVERVRGGNDTVYAGIIRNSDGKSTGEITEELRSLSTREVVYPKKWIRYRGEYIPVKDESEKESVELRLYFDGDLFKRMVLYAAEKEIVFAMGNMRTTICNFSIMKLVPVKSGGERSK